MRGYNMQHAQAAKNFVRSDDRVMLTSFVADQVRVLDHPLTVW
jgi:hypothetical protein